MNDLFLKEKKVLNTRLTFLYIIVAIVVGVLLVKLVNLQVVNGNENLFLSSTIKTSETIIRAPRGLIYDRNGNILVSNKPAFRLLIDPTELGEKKEKQVISGLASILDVKESQLWEYYYEKVYTAEGRKRNISQVLISGNVEKEKVVSIQSRAESLPGVYIEVATTRNYEEGERLAHVIGYIHEVSSEDLKTGEYVPGDVIGASGLEQFYDSELRGVNGKRVLETDRDLETVRELTPTEAKEGNNLQTSIDLKMQKKLTEALRNGMEKNDSPGGASVIMDVNTGEVLSMVSLPSFDSNKLIEGMTWDELSQLQNDPNSPFSNRAIFFANPPGSTFKTIVASAALEKGVITPNTVFTSRGCMEIAAGYDFCEVGKNPLGDLDLYHGLSRSSNIYFCETMLKLGIDDLNKYTTQFGLGQKTGIDLNGEVVGTVASREYKKEHYNQPWYLGDSCNASIGQGDTKVTPIQMVSWASAIANGGTYYKPHLGVGILDSNGNEISKIEPEIVRELDISGQNLEEVRRGMHLVVNDSRGSGFSLRGLKVDPAAKTGSAETAKGSGHSWVTGFFPYEDPQYAFVVYLEYGGWGFRSAEVMKEFLQWYGSEYSLD